MSPERRAGQLVMVGLTPTDSLGDAEARVARGEVGGIIYLGGWSGASAVKAAATGLQAAARAGGIRLLVAADQEGGQVQQLSGTGFTPIPPATEQGSMTPAALETEATGWARALAAVGVNVNLAPVADTVPASIGTANGPIGHWHREFGSTPQVVGPHAAAFVKGMHAGGIAATVKHFPGLGRITGNTDTTSAGITDSTATVDDPFLQSFADGIAAGADLVMVSSARYPNIDPDNQAVFSHAVVTDLLRGRLGFSGVVVTDDVGAAVAVSAVPVPDRAIRFVAAGGDIVLTARTGDVTPMVTALADRAAGDPQFAATVDAALLRVLTLKTARGLTTCSPDHGARPDHLLPPGTRSADHVPAPTTSAKRPGPHSPHRPDPRHGRSAGERPVEETAS
ncbi:MAG: glycoside hydrolase family 3 protein [Tetrasphaera sp.]|nr:glycoside hydrolase family 3 protein [Tetrasphaera sp.]